MSETSKDFFEYEFNVNGTPVKASFTKSDDLPLSIFIKSSKMNQDAGNFFIFSKAAKTPEDYETLTKIRKGDFKKFVVEYNKASEEDSE